MEFEVEWVVRRLSCLISQFHMRNHIISPFVLDIDEKSATAVLISPKADTMSDAYQAYPGKSATPEPEGSKHSLIFYF